MYFSWFASNAEATTETNTHESGAPQQPGFEVRFLKKVWLAFR